MSLLLLHFVGELVGEARGVIKGGFEPCVCLQGLCQMWRVLHRNLVRQAEEAALLPDVLGYVALVVLRDSVH